MLIWCGASLLLLPGLAAPLAAQPRGNVLLPELPTAFEHYAQEHLPSLLLLGVLFAGVALALFHLYLLNARRKRQAAALRAARARLKAVLDAMPDAAFILEDSGRVVEVLNDASALFRLPEPASANGAVALGQGRFLEELLPVECATLLTGASRAVMAAPAGTVQEVVFTLHGSWYEARLAQFHRPMNGGDEDNGRGNARGNGRSGVRDEAVCVIRDITVRKEMERSLQTARKDAEAMTHRLMDLDRIKTDLLSAVSQEIRTPLTSIFGFVVLVRKEFQRRIAPAIREATFRRPAEEAATLDAASSRILDNLRIVQEEGARLSRLVDDLLDLASLEAGKSEWHNEVVALPEVVEKSLGALASRMADRERVRLQVDMAPTLLPLYVDRERLQQVVVNLLDNALKFTQEGVILITGRLLDTGMVELAVEDAGPGIGPEALARVFEKFQHDPAESPSLRRQQRGSGLGLAICRNIVHHYGGEIQALSPPRPGKTGTRFEVRLPPAPLVLPTEQ
ncbi:sensor histidine kinase [Megalodesulfovibrio paquesii]